MSLYQVVIVDDEEIFRKGLIDKIQWESFGFTVIGDASNGLEALEIIEQTVPDLLITDIKMPYMDGLELIEALSKRPLNTKIVILSGFDDFEYAQTALKYSVTDYLLKPVSANQMIKTLQNIKSNMDDEFHARKDIELLQQNYQAILPLLREQFLTNLLHNKMSAEKITEGVSRYNLDVNSQQWVVCLVQIHSIVAPEEIGGEALGLLLVKQIFDECIDRIQQKNISFFSEDSLMILFGYDHESELDYFLEALQLACQISQKVVRSHTCAGIGSPQSSLQELYLSYNDARSALGYCTINQDMNTMYIRDVEPQMNQRTSLSSQEEQQLLETVKLGTSDNIVAFFASLFLDLDNSVVDYDAYQIYSLEIFFVLLRIADAYDISPESIFGNISDGFQLIYTSHSYAKIKSWLLGCALHMNEVIKSIHTNSSKRMIDDAKNYIQDHYTDSTISVNALCDYLHVSSAYFSTLFKKEEGISFVSYLTNIRLQKAIDLLNTTDDKTYMIAEKIGYADPNYFSYVFKKKYGIAPSKYRQTHQPLE